MAVKVLLLRMRMERGLMILKRSRIKKPPLKQRRLLALEKSICSIYFSVALLLFLATLSAAAALGWP